MPDAPPTPLAPAAGAPTELGLLRRRVHAAVGGFLDRQREALTAIGPECTPLVESIADLVLGGKCLRPAFCYWGYRGAGGEDGEDVVTAAASLELFQAAALIHDDLMDGSDLRRGRPAVHRQFATRHGRAGWAGDGEGFGLSAAVIAGDLCLVWSAEMLAGSGLGAAALQRAQPVLDQMRSQVMVGQYLDMYEQVAAALRPEQQVERARRVIRYKSAKYTVEHPLLLGGHWQDAPAELLTGYSRFGLDVGEAFQLRDDVLGVFGDPERTGKPAGDDLREGKRTVLVAHAQRAATPAQAARLEQLFGDPGLDAAGVATLREIIVDTGALATVESSITALVGSARATLAAMDLADPAREVFERLVVAVAERSM